MMTTGNFSCKQRSKIKREKLIYAYLAVWRVFFCNSQPSCIRIWLIKNVCNIHSQRTDLICSLDFFVILFIVILQISSYIVVKMCVCCILYEANVTEWKWHSIRSHNNISYSTNKIPSNSLFDVRQGVCWYYYCEASKLI